jgi:probable addiction module antidote protein
MTTQTRAPDTAPTPAPRRKPGPKTVVTAPYDPADYLTTPAKAQALLEVAFEEDDGDGKLIAHALGAAARARGMAEVAAAAGLNPTTIYRSLSPNNSPSLTTVLRVLRALGYRLTPIPQGEAEAQDSAE